MSKEVNTRRGTRAIQLALVSVLMIVVALPASAGHSFDDVDHDDTFHADIEAFSASGITQGCDERRFCPGDRVTRGQMAAFLRRALEGTLMMGPSLEFSDDNGSEFEADIEWLAATGVTRGCGGDRFCPDDPVTRGQMAAFLRRALEGTVPLGAAVQFSDDDDSEFEADIEWLAATGITMGCGGDRFCPGDAVTREQMAAFLRRALKLPANPLLAGRLEGNFDIVFTVITSDGFEQPGDTYDYGATYMPSCRNGPCATTDSALGVVYDYDPATGTYSAQYQFETDCVDSSGNLVLTDGYKTNASERIWVGSVGGDQRALTVRGEARNEYTATSAARAANCTPTGLSTYAIVGTITLDGPQTAPIGRQYRGAE